MNDEPRVLADMIKTQALRRVKIIAGHWEIDNLASKSHEYALVESSLTGYAVPGPW